MFRFEGKYGNININGMSKDIEKSNANELKEYVKDLENRRIKLIEQQNSYLSKIIG